MSADRFRRPTDLAAPSVAAGPDVSTAFVPLPPGFFIPVTPDVLVLQQSLYQWAYSQAQELLRPSLVERDWLGVWN